MTSNSLLIQAIRMLAEDLPLSEHYRWDIPQALPIEIKEDMVGSFERNLYLKENLMGALENDADLHTTFWIIQQWGKIGGFKDNKDNRLRISDFYKRLPQGKLTRDLHGVLPSLSKLAAFRWPDCYSIYDSRAVFALNWLLFCHTDQPKLFPQPPARNKALVELDLETLFLLSGREYSVRSHKTSYHEYCRLLSDLSREALGQERPYHAEMLLFVAAEKWVPDDIRRRTTVTISVKSSNASNITE